MVSPAWIAAQQPGAPPATEKIPVTDSYHGVSVTDDYRWLENWDDPKVKAWVAAQNAYTQSYVSKLPQRPAIVEFLKNEQKPSRLPEFRLCGRNALCAQIRSGEVGGRAGGFQFAKKTRPASAPWST